MKQSQNVMKPQDVVILLKIVAKGNENWFHHTLAEDLAMSQSEVTQSLNRSRYAQLINDERKKVNVNALLDFLQYGISYVFPQQPGAIARGIATAHSAYPLKKFIDSYEDYVWPSAKGKDKGQAIIPLYKSVVSAIQKDEKLYELLSLVDAVRVGRVREKEIAIKELRKRLLHVKE